MTAESSQDGTAQCRGAMQATAAGQSSHGDAAKAAAAESPHDGTVKGCGAMQTAAAAHVLPLVPAAEAAPPSGTDAQLPLPAAAVAPLSGSSV